MAADYETCLEELHKLAKWYASRVAQRNEATTRLHLIDRLLLECLGWTRDDVSAEDRQEGEYTDYTCSTARRVLIIEAKREGEYFELPAGKQRPQYKINGLRRDYPALKKALDQVMAYCQHRGVPYGAVSNGSQIIAVIAARNDGIAPQHGTALVFPSFDAMLVRFPELWKALSKPAMQDEKLGAILTGSRAPHLPPKLSASLSVYPGYKDRNVFQTDLQIVTEIVMEGITRSPELEALFLKDCYCSSGALSQHSLISKRILAARYAALFDPGGAVPALVAAHKGRFVTGEVLAKAYSRRPILIIGDVGVGKTTFTRHLITVEAPDVFKNIIALYLDLGSQATMISDGLKNWVLSELSRQLLEEHAVDVHEAPFVRGVYHRELERFKRGIYGDLRATDKTQYDAEERRYLTSLLENTDEHLRRSLEHLQKERRKQVVIFLDNIDQRSYDTQEAAFLIAQEMASHWSATVFLALRPETVSPTRRGGVLSAYHPKAFTIPPPRTEHVIERRVRFARKLTSGDIVVDSLGGRAVESFGKLDTMLDVFLYSLAKNPELIECIDNIAAGNMRRALDLVRGYFGSGHVDTQKIVERRDKDQRYIIRLHDFLRAVIYGDAAYYDPGASCVTNLFDVASEDPKEHFLVPLIVAMLHSNATGACQDTGFVEAKRVYEEMQGLQFLPRQIDWALTRSRDKALIEQTGRAELAREEERPYSYRVTTLGAYHVARLATLVTYVDAVIVDTPLFDDATRAQIRDVRSLADRLDRCDIFRKYLDEAWAPLSKQRTVFDWHRVSEALVDDIAHVRSLIGEATHADGAQDGGTSFEDALGEADSPD
ncbi:MAG TPA: hypothetical protein VM487_07530 [Phycisphaerae bacterium]|nr:hypothetical protein [Phycisphaerae bacterium]